jgi:hypothetical protein
MRHLAQIRLGRARPETARVGRPVHTCEAVSTHASAVPLRYG